MKNLLFITAILVTSIPTFAHTTEKQTLRGHTLFMIEYQLSAWDAEHIDPQEHFEVSDCMRIGHLTAMTDKISELSALLYSQNQMSLNQSELAENVRIKAAKFLPYCNVNASEKTDETMSTLIVDLQNAIRELKRSHGFVSSAAMK